MLIRFLTREVRLARLDLKGVALSAIVLALLWAGCLVAWFAFPPSNRVAVRNSSPRELRDVHVEVVDSSTTVVVDERVGRLPPGETLLYEHESNDSTMRLSFSLDGRQIRHEDFVDLWTGQGWIFNVRKDGVVESGYDHSGSELTAR